MEHFRYRWKKDFLLFNSFGIKGLKIFIVKDNEKTVAKVLKGVDNLKEDKKNKPCECKLCQK